MISSMCSDPVMTHCTHKALAKVRRLSTITNTRFVDKTMVGQGPRGGQQAAVFFPFGFVDTERPYRKKPALGRCTKRKILTAYQNF